MVHPDFCVRDPALLLATAGGSVRRFDSRPAAATARPFVGNGRIGNRGGTRAGRRQCGAVNRGSMYASTSCDCLYTALRTLNAFALRVEP